MEMELTISLTVIGMGLLAFGLVYAYKVSMHPFHISLSWLSAAIGSVVTNVGVSLALWLIVHNWLAVIVPWVAYVLTGIPVILALVFKFQVLSKTARERAERANNAPGVAGRAAR
jgi:fatty acid desaturase